MLKKTGYIISGVLILVFCIGNFNPDVTFECSIVVKKPLNDTYQLFQAREDLSNWLPHVIASKTIQLKPDKTGSVYEITSLNGNDQMVFIEKIVDFRLNRLLGLESERGFLLRQDNYLFEALSDNTTRIINDSRCEGANFVSRCLYAFSSARLIKEEEQYLQAFKKYAEETASL